MGNQNIIPFFGIKRQYQHLQAELLEVTDAVYSSGKVLDGEYTHEFERSIALRCEREFAISVNSCTQAIVMVLQSCDNPGNILIPTVSFAATVNSVLLTDHNPRFCDVDHKGLMDLSAYNSNLAEDNIAAVMYANLFGNIVDWEKFHTYTKFFGNDTFVIEDAAQSFGARYKGIPSGKLGDVSVLSFDPTKNLPNYGSGGMILTDDWSIADLLKNFRDNGKPSNHILPGSNSKMNEADCAQMLVKLNYFDQWQLRRAAIADYYIEQLLGYVDVVMPNEHVEHAWHKFVIRVESRNRLRHHLSTKGIETKIHYEIPLTGLDCAYQFIGDSETVMGEKFCKESLSLPIYPELTDSEVEHIVQSVKEFYC